MISGMPSMDKREIVKKFAERGVLLSPQLLEKINETNIGFYLKKAEGKKHPIFDKTKKEGGIRIRIKRAVVREKITPGDFVEYYNNRYNGLRKILLDKISPVSINNAKKSFSSVSIIGMVTELTQTGFIVEDTTGRIEVVSKNKVDVDDVIGIGGVVREGKLFENGLVFPGVPETNRLRKIDGVKILLTKKFSDEHGASFVFAEESNKTNKNIFTGFTNPSWISISKGNDKINIVVYKPAAEASPDTAIKYLVKRHLMPEIWMIKSPDDCFLLEQVPDILWVLSNRKWARNYRGVTLISCGNGSAVIDLGKREVEFI